MFVLIVMGDEVARQRIHEIVTERPLKVYWETATTESPHIAYFVPMMKIADFLRAGCEVTILFADLHAYLDNQKTPWTLLDDRVAFYREILSSMLREIGVPLDLLIFKRSSDYQLSRDFTLDMYKLTTITTRTTKRNAKCAAQDEEEEEELDKRTKTRFMSGLLHPLLQVLDEEYLKVDCRFGCIDQRKFFSFAERSLPRLKFTQRVHLMNPMVPEITNAKMSSTIDLLDSTDAIRAKMKSAFCPPQTVEGNGVLAFVRFVLFAPRISSHHSSRGFTICREDKYGGNVHFQTYDQLEVAYVQGAIFPLDLKNNVCNAIDTLLHPIREHFNTTEMKIIVERAHPKHTASQNNAVMQESDKFVVDA